jgi:putative PIG3 family NAD(P)H quinone oxidoreductase
MKAILVNEPGGVEMLVIKNYPAPQIQQDELLVRVKATALNRADILQRMGKYPPPKGASPVLGLEMAGIVEEVGTNCSGWRTGDRVCGLLPGGGYAEYVAIPAKIAMPIPETLSFEEAAAIPEVFLTAFQALYWLGGLKPGQNVLVHAGASGVGTAAIQLIKEAGANAIVTSGSAKKLDFCLKLGAKIAINYNDGEFAKQVLEATGNQGVDIILDFIGASYMAQNLASLAPDGRLILLATMGGGQVNQFNLMTILRKRLHIIGSTLRARSLEYKIQLTNDFVKKILPGFSDGRYKPIVDSVYSWKQAAEAHQRMEANLNMGKIILRIDEEKNGEKSQAEERSERIIISLNDHK